MKTDVVMQGPTLRLTPLRPDEDAAELWEAAQPLEETMRYTYAPPRNDRDSVRAWLRRHVDTPARENWTIRIAATGRAIGEAMFQDVFTLREAGLWIGARWHGTRAYPETLYLQLREVFEVRGWHRVQFRIHVDNARSVHAVKRSGQIVEGRLRESFDNGDGTWSDQIVTSCLSSEWPPASQALRARMEQVKPL